MANRIKDGNILISEFDGRKFQAYLDNRSYDKKFNTYQACVKFINKNGLNGYEPRIGWHLGVGKYHESWDWIMKPAHKVMMATIEGDQFAENVNSALIEAFCKADIDLMFDTIVEYLQHQKS